MAGSEQPGADDLSALLGLQFGSTLDSIEREEQLKQLRKFAVLSHDLFMSMLETGLPENVALALTQSTIASWSSR